MSSCFDHDAFLNPGSEHRGAPLREEILRIDNIMRETLGFPLRMEALAQPWTDRAPIEARHRLDLRFSIASDIAVSGARLALEEASRAKIIWNGEPVSAPTDGWFVDEDIATVPLPDFGAGRHELVVSLAYDRKANPEWFYLLGDFGVTLMGRETRLTAPVRQLGFGDWTRQGLPFYAGNVTYHCSVPTGMRASLLRVTKFKAPLLVVAADGRDVGEIAFAPFEIALPAGVSALDITAFGSRINAFGALHNADEDEIWFGPNAWRTQGDAWSYEYQLKPAGVLVAPRLLGSKDG